MRSTFENMTASEKIAVIGDEEPVTQLYLRNCREGDSPVTPATRVVGPLLAELCARARAASSLHPQPGAPQRSAHAPSTPCHDLLPPSLLRSLLQSGRMQLAGVDPTRGSLHQLG